MRKLTDKKIRGIIRELEAGAHPDEIARFVRFTKRRFNQLKRRFKEKSIIPQLKVPGRKKKSVSPEFELIILKAYQNHLSVPVILEKIIKKIYRVAGSYNTL